VFFLFFIVSLVTLRFVEVPKNHSDHTNLQFGSSKDFRSPGVESERAKIFPQIVFFFLPTGVLSHTHESGWLQLKCQSAGFSAVASGFCNLDGQRTSKALRRLAAIFAKFFQYKQRRRSSSSASESASKRVMSE